MSLSLVLLIPFVASFLIFFLSLLTKGKLKTLSFFFAIVPLILFIYGANRWIGVEINTPWLSQLGVFFHFRIDALASLFLFLTSLIIPLTILIFPCNEEKSGIFFSLVLLLQGLLFAFFTARDLAVFTFFWEAMLLPLYFIVNLWGKEGKEQASLKFLVMMAAGTLLMIISVLLLFATSGSFDLDHLAKISGKLPNAEFILAGFLLAFAVKTPLFPFHSWLPDVYVKAPTSGTILLSSLLSKAGIFGIVRIALELFPKQMLSWNPLLLSFAVVGVFYAGFAAWRQHDFKRLLAYSSLSHVNFILAGLFIAGETARTGAILQAFNHGITIAGLFLVANWLEDRIGTTSMKEKSGLAKNLPLLCWMTLFFVLSSIALPGTNSFVGEVLILFGLFGKDPAASIVLAGSVILSAMYMLRWMQKMYFKEPDTALFKDIRAKEMIVALPLIFMVLWVGIYPKPFLKQIEFVEKPVSELELTK